jgi:membrane fusion protein, multidrug efflux system
MANTGTRHYQLAATLIAALTLGACGNEPAQHAAAREKVVGTYTIQEQSLVLTTKLPGRTVASQISEVRPQVSGILQKRLFEEGAAVTAGQILYQIDAAPYKAALARAEANFDAARNQWQRFQNLIKSNAISQQQLDDAEAAWKSARAELDSAKINMAYTEVRAPINGKTGRSLVTQGALVTNGQTNALTTVTQLDPIYIDISQPISKVLQWRKELNEGRLKRISPQQASVSLTLEDGSTYPLAGSLKFSEVQVQQSTGSVTLRAEFPNPDGALLPGMFVHAELQEGERNNATLLPQEAILRDPSGHASVWVVKDDNTIERRAISIERMIGNTVLVEEGVQAGEAVITEGLRGLRPGLQVSPRPAQNLDMTTSFALASQ